MLKLKKNTLTETEYDMTAEGKHAALMTTGNGYMGVRGSFEEFGSIRIQGCYVRGLFDRIIEVMEPFADNEYMKKFYIDEVKLRNFEYQDSVINIADILPVRIAVNGETFYPWEGKVLHWDRTLCEKDETLVRTVEWENAQGNRVLLKFERFASWSDMHLYCQRVSVTTLNFEGEVGILAGIDTNVKTCGQKTAVQREISFEEEGVLSYEALAGEHFRSPFGIVCKCRQEGGKRTACGTFEEDGLCGYRYTLRLARGERATLEKCTYVGAQIDYGQPVSLKQCGLEAVRAFTSYAAAYAAHLSAYAEKFEKMDVNIEGDAESDAAVRFANYHTLISGDFFSSVHGLSAKGLTGEKYNNFVWWDAEIYQLPFFIHLFPQVAKNSVLYRYRQLDDARKNAAAEGCEGARFPFVSSVDGKEKVWAYARHPFMQIHITADVAYSVLSYFANTGDLELMREAGFEILYEICRYWVTKVSSREGKYVLPKVTGTDEHHPYVDNDAYTNYLVRFVLAKSAELFKKYAPVGGEKFSVSDKDIARFEEVADKMFLPRLENGMIPQFDGYFSLSPTLVKAGGKAATGFQMKTSGLYHRSQIIKQPDVMLLFAYLPLLEMDPAVYGINWDYYEGKCEASSSLTYPVNAVNAIDCGTPYKFLKYLKDSALVDYTDIFGTAWQGVHSGCMAGAWYSIFRGVFGIRAMDGYLRVEPKYVPAWTGVKIRFEYRGCEYAAELRKDSLRLRRLSGDEPLRVLFGGKEYTVRKSAVFATEE